MSTGRHQARVSGAPEVYGELPITCLAEEIETPGEGQIRALITVATNPVLSSPNGPRLSAALEQLDFMLSLDIYLNETTRHADVILPGLSPLEDLHYDVAFPQLSWRNHARYSPPVLPRPAGQPEEWETLLKLAAIVRGQSAQADASQLDIAQFEEDAQRMFGSHAAAVIAATQHLRGPQRNLDVALRSGPYGDQFGLKPEGLTLQKVMDANAAGGIDLGELQPRIPEMLRTPSGKVELAPPLLLQDLQRAAQDLRRLAPDLVIIGRRDVRTNNSWMHNLPTLAKGPFRCTALVHPDDAARHGVVDGAMATLAQRPAQRAGASADQRSDDARRGQPAARLGPQPARRPAARGCRATRRQHQCPVGRPAARPAFGECRVGRRSHHDGSSVSLWAGIQAISPPPTGPSQPKIGLLRDPWHDLASF